jgi:hypothetical protein
MKCRILLIAATIMFAGAAPNAYAADHELYSKDDVFPGESPGAHMWFNEHGDVVTVCDNDADGMKASVSVHVNGVGSAPTYTVAIGGDGRCTTRKASTGRRFNLPENRKITFYACVDQGLGPHLCGRKTWFNDH